MAWRHVGPGWQRVFGCFRSAGFSVEWHEFKATKPLDWGASFHPDSLEICLNLVGEGTITTGNQAHVFASGTAGFYTPGNKGTAATRNTGSHQFLTVEYSRAFLEQHLNAAGNLLHPLAQGFLGGQNTSAVSAIERLTLEQEQIIATLRQPPVYAVAHPLWYQCKALELAVAFFFQPPPEGELFCTRQKRLARERSEQVIFLLRQGLNQPPALEEIARKVGCSPFHLSRIFSAETGQTITQCLRRLRLEKAAELLAAKQLNVTEVALEVGYNSLSHFSQAFTEMFGCCPGLYPMATTTQRASGKLRTPSR